MKWFFAFFIMFGVLCQPALALEQTSSSIHQMMEHDQEPTDIPFQHEENEECEEEVEVEDDFISEKQDSLCEIANQSYNEYGALVYVAPYLEALSAPKSLTLNSVHTF